MQGLIDREFDIGQALGDTWRATIAGYGPYVLFVGVIAGPVFAWSQWRSLEMAQSADLSLWPQVMLVSVLYWIVLKLAHGFILVHGFARLRGQPVDVSSALRVALARWPWLIVVSFAWVIQITLGAMCFCIPGILIGVVFYPVQPVVTLEGRGPIDSFSRAWDLTEGLRLQVFAVGAIIVIADMVLQGLLQVWLAVTGPSWPIVVISTIKIILTEPFKAMVYASVYLHLLRAVDGVEVDDVAEVFS